MKTLQRFYMPYMNRKTLDRLEATGTVKRFNENDSYSMYEYDGPLELSLFDRHYSIKGEI